MIRLPVTALEPGMVLAAPIPHPAAHDRILLNAGFRFNADIIRQLDRFAVYTVWVQHPGFDFLDERMGEAVPRSRIVLYDTVKTTFTAVAQRTTGAFNLHEYRTVVGNMIFAMLSDKHHAVWAERILQGASELFGHSANVAYLSLLIGMRLRHYLAAERKYVVGSEAEDLTNLGIGAMFHDFGKLMDEPEVQRRHLINVTEDDYYREHPARGYRALQGRIEATAAAVVLHHHQRFDGNGFPAPKRRTSEREQHKLSGKRIHVFARVVSVANILDALVNASLQQGEPVVAALARIQEETFRGMFDPVILEAAIRCVPPFPLCTAVGLSNGRKAVVTDLNPTQPCRPKVRLLQPARKPSDEAGEEIDLSQPDAPAIISEGGRGVRTLVQRFEAARPPVLAEQLTAG